MTSVAVLGSTGSIGTQALEVIAAEPERFTVLALGAARSVDLLAEQAERFRPQVVALADNRRAKELAGQLPSGTELVAGPDALSLASEHADVVVNGVVGFAGLSVTLAALSAGRRLALANKESLIAGGPIVQRVRKTPGATIIPVDSEHCAVHQCLRTGREGEVARIVLTASGGPFRGRRRSELADVTVDEALSHPTWSMGPKITIDSSTLMNKGLEVIEAHELFGTPFGRIEVLVHPQSVVHSMVEFSDGATMAQLSLPDMRLPLAYALSYPERSGVPFGRIDWAELDRLDFEAPDHEAFPCLGLAYEAGQSGGSAPAWLNAANEVAVAAFLEGRIRWQSIAEVLKTVMEEHDGTVIDDLDVLLDVDRRARERAHRVVKRRTAA